MPTRTSAGAGNAYTVTTSSVPIALVDGVIVYFYADKSNSGAATLAANAFSSFPLRAKTGVELRSGELQSGSVIGAYFRSASNEWIVVNSGLHVGLLAAQYVSGSTFGINVGDIKLSLRSTPDAGFLRLTELSQSLLKTAYPELNAWASAQGYPWGSTGTNFSIPPAGGYFLRFGASNATVDPDGVRIAGSTQADQFKTHTHTGTTAAGGAHTHTVTQSVMTNGFSSGLNGSVADASFIMDSGTSEVAIQTQANPTTTSASATHTRTHSQPTQPARLVKPGLSRSRCTPTF